jgi:hypothetical protein
MRGKPFSHGSRRSAKVNRPLRGYSRNDVPVSSMNTSSNVGLCN